MSLLIKIYLRVHKVLSLIFLRKVTNLGVNVTAGRGLYITNNGKISIGDNVSFANDAYLSTYTCGKLSIGSDCFFGDNCKIVTDKSTVSIGDDCLVAEHVSIRASNHGIKLGSLIRNQKNSVSPVFIGNDVWIGKGSTILAGSRIPDGCVIGANSLVLGKSELRENCIYGGVPVKFLSKRKLPIGQNY